MGGPDELRPRLHEEQILEHQKWREEHELRVAAHAERVAAHLRQLDRPGRNGDSTKGKRQAAWCIELKRSFASLTEAGRFVGRPPSNIIQAIRTRNRCGKYHWEYFDAARHG
jgi:hypothetical protein